MKNRLKSFYLLSFILGLFIAGCGKDEAPDPPITRSRTVLDTYKSLENREHKASLMKIQRLRDIDPSNVFLANLEILEKTNSVISEAQQKLDNGDLEGALASVAVGKRKYGGHKDIVNTENKLKVFKKISEILEIFRNPRDSDQLKAAATQLRKLGTAYKPASIFLPLADQKLIEAAIINKWEIKRAISSLCSQINELHINNDSDVFLLYAVLEIMDPDNPMLMNYMEYLNGADVDLVIYPEENIFAGSEDSEKEDKKEEDKRTTVEDQTPEENKKPVENKKPEEEKKGSWWDKFSF